MNLLACDLGGTKTDIGIYSDDKYIHKIYQKKYNSKDWENFNEILKNFLSDIPKNISKPQYACIAVAGQVQKSKVKITNLSWYLEKELLLKEFKFKKLELINDFRVLIYGIPFIRNSQYYSLQKVENKADDPDEKFVSIIGAGTGLGISRGLMGRDNILSFPSEGGHREFSARTQEEWDFCQWLKTKLKIERVSIERVVSGKGLSDLARWRITKKDAIDHPISKLKSDNPKSSKGDLAPFVIQYAKNGDGIMTEVLEMWLSAYGAAVGDLALQEVCSSSIWISGGIAAKNLDSIKSKTFMKSLRNKGRFSEFLRSIPIKVLTDKEFGLFSAACRAHLISKDSKEIT